MTQTERRQWLPLVALLAFASQPLLADKNPDNPDAKFKEATAKKQFDQAATILCDAAKTDPKKYEKRCATAQQFAIEQLQSYDALYTAGKPAFDHEDYATAARDLGKIYFGPHFDEAQRLTQQAVYLQTHPQEVADSNQALEAAREAYSRGDLTAAAASAHAVKLIQLQPLVQQILTNIKIYNDTVQQADTFMQAGNYIAAQQKYKFAQVILPAGPGNPTGKLQQIADRISPAKAPDKTSPALTAPKPTIAAGNKLKSTPVVPVPTAVTPTSTSAVNPEPPTAPPQPQTDEAALATGIRHYYRSQFTETTDSLLLYLKNADAKHKGAAYFYLGATFATQIFLLEPKDTVDQTLRERALQNFRRARCEQYRPIERYLSPRVLILWNHSGCIDKPAT